MARMLAHHFFFLLAAVTTCQAALRLGTCTNFGEDISQCQQYCKYDGSCVSYSSLSTCSCNGELLDASNQYEGFNANGSPKRVLLGRKRRDTEEEEEDLCSTIPSCGDNCNLGVAWKQTISSCNDTTTGVEERTGSFSGVDFQLRCPDGLSGKVRAYRFRRGGQDEERYLEALRDRLNVSMLAAYVVTPGGRPGDRIAELTVCNDEELAAQTGTDSDAAKCLRSGYKGETAPTELVKAFLLDHGRLFRDQQSQFPESGCFVPCPSNDNKPQTYCEEVKFEDWPYVEMTALEYFLHGFVKAALQE